MVESVAHRSTEGNDERHLLYKAKKVRRAISGHQKIVSESVSSEVKVQYMNDTTIRARYASSLLG